MSKRSDKPLVRRQTTPASIMTKTLENTKANEQRDAALEQIFHPDKFNIAQFSHPGSETNLDEGSRFYTSKTETDLLDLVAKAEEKEAEGGGLRVPSGSSGPLDRSPILPFRPGPFNRSASMNFDPVTDTNRRQSLATNTFSDYMKAVDDHHVEHYPHTHHIMHRMKPKMLKRAETDQQFGAKVMAGGQKIKRSKSQEGKFGKRKLSEGVLILPTIEDEESMSEEHEEVPETRIKKDRDGSVSVPCNLQSYPSSSLAVDTIFEEELTTDEEGGKEGGEPDKARKPVKKHSGSTGFDNLGHVETDNTTDEEKKHGKKPFKPAFSIAPDSDNEDFLPASRRESVDSFFDHPHPHHLADKKVSFQSGMSGASSFAEDSKDEEGGGEDGDGKVKKKKRKRRKHVPFAEDIVLRRSKGSELQMDARVLPTEEEELKMLAVRDVDDMASHRMDHVHSGVATRHLVRRKSSMATIYNIAGINEMSPEKKENMIKLVDKMFGVQSKELDHTPHDLFVELDVLRHNQWVEMSRWIKYEETREEGSERWGKAHISSLSFHSLLNLRLCLESGVFLLDLEARDFASVVHRVVEEFNIEDMIQDEQKGLVLKVLLYKHDHVNGNAFKLGIKKSHSQKSLKTLMHDSSELGHTIKAFGSATVGHHLNDVEKGESKDGDHLVGDAQKEGLGSREATNADLYKTMMAHKEGILRRLKEGTEGTIALVGALEELTTPLVAFVRLAEGIIMPNALEVPLPMRFVFILLTPKPSTHMDAREVGRSFSTLMSNPKFHNVCYRIEERRELLSAINEFLDESVVLPPGDWESKNLLSINEIQEMRRRRKEKEREDEGLLRKSEQQEEDDKKEKKKMEAFDQEEEEKRKATDPMIRTNVPFGGLFNDIKRRYKHYLSDFKDGINMQVVSATIFIYFACLSGAIAFGGLTGEKTENLIGIPVTLMVSCVAGIIFALFAGCPLIIVGVTGPVLLFDEALFNFSKNNNLEFLPWRVWIGLWGLLISLLVALFQGSTLVKFFTKFTKDIFASLVALLFVFEAIKKLVSIFGKHPLLSKQVYCNSTSLYINNRTIRSVDGLEDPNAVVIIDEDDDSLHGVGEPNTALLSAILMFGTFFIAYFLRVFRNGRYLGRTVRRALGDFGVPIAIVIMVTSDILIDDTYTQKLKVPTGLQVTSPDKRDWLVSPMGYSQPIQVWAPFAAAVPAILLYLLLFMETHICELIMMEKTNKKGGGLHLDIVLLCLINCLGTFFGGPWICAATVRAVSHVSALSVLSTTHAPGETAKIVDVRDQRVSGLVVSIMVGLSVLLAPILKHVPYAVLFGVFLYMGISSIHGIQFFDRVSLLFMPVKHHPQVSYVRRVKTWKMHMFTLLQVLGLAVLWAVKSTQLALFFPFFVVAMIPYRMCLKFIYSPRELDALDGPKAGHVVHDDIEPDFYNQAFGA